MGWYPRWVGFLWHRREVLQASRCADAYSNTFFKPSCNSYSDRNNNTQSYRYTYFNTKSYTYITATPYTGASPVSAALVSRLPDYKNN